jgi:hypothetical protein
VLAGHSMGDEFAQAIRADTPGPDEGAPDLDVSVRSIRRRSSAPHSRQSRAIGRRRRSARIASSRRVRLPDPRTGTARRHVGRLRPDVTSNRRREQWPRAVTMT